MFTHYLDSVYYLYMKILAISDMHGMLNHLDLSNVDLALFAGDIASLKGRGPWHIYDQVKWMNKKFYDFCMSFPKTKIVFVPGNHDFFPIAKTKFRNELLGKELNVKLASNAAMLIDEVIDIYADNANPADRVRIYGTPWVPIISHSWAFEAEHDILKDKFSHIPSKVDILLTHTPPRFNYLDVSLEYGVNSDKFGSHELANEILKKEPKFCFCGHIHSGDHNMNMLGNTAVYNVARVNESYRIAYDPVVIEI